MATKKITQSSIKRLVSDGAAKDIDRMRTKPKVSDLDVIGISYGIYGMNGALFINRKSKKLYAITARSSTLFQYV